MQESHYKRQLFHKQIRQRQHQQIFKKIRAKNQQYLSSNTPQIKQIQQLLRNLPKMYKLSQTIQLIVENTNIIIEYIANIRKFQDNQQILKNGWQFFGVQSLRYQDRDQKQRGTFVPLLQYLLFVVKIIHQHMMIDIESYEIVEDEYQNREIPFTQIMLPISYLLINITAQNVCIDYICIISQFMNYRIFIDAFHNIFLTQNLSVNIKKQLVNQYLTQLQHYPLLFLNNCNIFIKILFYCLTQQPRMLSIQYNGQQQRVLALIQKISSILEFSDKLLEDAKKQFKIYSNQILEKLSVKNQINCWKIVNSTSVMKLLSEMLGDLRGLFIAKGKFDQNYIFQHLIGTTKVLSNLTYFDDIACHINECYPLIWINLLSIFQRISVQAWIGLQNKNLPAIFQLQQFSIILIRTLKCISNFVCIPQLCQNFMCKQYKNSNQNKMMWIDILTYIYNNHYKISQIRVQCLCILSNALVITSKLEIDYCGENKQMQQNELYGTIKILNSSADLIFEVLKLSNNHKDIILTILKALVAIIEKSQSIIYKCSLFRDNNFMNRLHLIAESNLDQNKYTKYDYYSDDVKLQAHQLIEAILISN